MKKQRITDNYRTASNKKRGRLFSMLILILILGGILTFWLGRSYYFKTITSPNSDSTEKAAFEIESGESIDQITERLVEEGLLAENKKNVFKLYIRLEDVSSKIQAGNFLIPKNLSIEELVTTLQKGGIVEIWVQVPEGVRKDQVADTFEVELNSNGGNFSREEFLLLVDDPVFINERTDIPFEIDTLEGFLFPDKYLIPIISTEEEIIQIMLDNFFTKTQEFAGELSYEDIIIASMIEREGKGIEDKKIVSGVIRKRLREGWFLEIDATLLYPKKDWKHVITIQDKAEDSPYNTYKSIGLPPTPICNPSYNSIKASMRPLETEYYYYIHGNDGKPRYAKTYSEHLQNIQKYLKNE